MSKGNKKIKRVGIDARFYGPVGKGLGRYVKEVIDRVLLMDDKNEYVIFLSPENFDYFVSPNKRIKKVLTNVRWYTLKEQILMPLIYWREKIDLLHIPHFNVPLLCPVKFVVTIHDLILTKYSTERATTLGPILYYLKNLGYRIGIYLAIKRAKKIIAVSEFTKRDIMEQFKVRSEKIAVTYEGVFKTNKEQNIADKKIILGYNIDKPYLLYVGNAYPHKNLEGLIKIMPKLREKFSDISLVLVGKEDYFYKRAKQYARKIIKKENFIIFPGFVPDKDLQILYKYALAYIFPSLYEGFGLPPLEAMSAGCPVISSDKTSMPEILGSAAYYFNPEKEDEFLAAIIKVVSDDRLKEDLRKRGYERIKRYSWDECAKKTLKIYDDNC